MCLCADTDDPQAARRVHFKVVYVFDIAQTVGEPLAPVPDWSSPEENAALTARLVALVESLDI